MSSQGVPVRENAAPQVLVEIKTKYDTFKLELKTFTTELGECREFYWLSRNGDKRTGVSVRRHEMKALVDAFGKILDENDGDDR